MTLPNMTGAQPQQPKRPATMMLQVVAADNGGYVMTANGKVKIFADRTGLDAELTAQQELLATNITALTATS